MKFESQCNIAEKFYIRGRIGIRNRMVSHLNAVYIYFMNVYTGIMY